jgi:phosphate/sulfate permease
MSDLRVTIGGFFVLTGAIVGGTGVVSDYRAPIEGANVNLYCGISMLIFGGILLALAWRKSRL